MGNLSKQALGRGILLDADFREREGDDERKSTDF